MTVVVRYNRFFFFFYEVKSESASLFLANSFLSLFQPSANPKAPLACQKRMGILRGSRLKPALTNRQRNTWTQCTHKANGQFSRLIPASLGMFPLSLVTNKIKSCLQRWKALCSWWLLFSFRSSCPFFYNARWINCKCKTSKLFKIFFFFKKICPVAWTNGKKKTDLCSRGQERMKKRNEQAHTEAYWSNNYICLNKQAWIYYLFYCFHCFCLKSPWAWLKRSRVHNRLLGVPTKY